MQSLRYLLQHSPPRTSVVLAILATLVTALSLATSATAKPPARTVTDVFAVSYDAKVSFEHHKAHPEFSGDDNLRYQIHGRLPEVTFVDGVLQTNQSAVVKTTAKGFAGSEVKQDPWSMNCVGTKVKVRGLVGLAHTDNGFSFLPALSSEPRGRCLDSDGVRTNFTWNVGWPGEGIDGAKTFSVSAKSIDVRGWSQPFRVVFEDEKCPNYEPDLTIACTFVVQGKLTLTRVDREEAVNGEVLLPALDPPKLNPQKNKVTTTIECQSGCDVEALIGVFGGTAKNPKVTPLHKKKLHLEGGKPTTLSMPLTAQDRAAAKTGLLVMTLRAEGGKEQVYPLSLGGLPNDVGEARLSSRRDSVLLAAPRSARGLAFPGRAGIGPGGVTLSVSNPNGFRAEGSLELRLGKRRLGAASLAVPAHGERKLTVKLDAAARATLERRKPQRLNAVARFRDPAGQPRQTSGSVALKRIPGAGSPPPSTPNGPSTPAEPPAGPDGTYHGSDGLTVIIAAGKVTSFNGQISTYCTQSESQKLVPFGMFGDDPDPQVGSDGSFAYEATTGYGFVKLKYTGRLSGDTLTGNLVVEDRSPLSTSDGRLEFDYCFAGADWTATR